ncbi:MAG: hypothetical protein HY744_13675 [Deltaproteobacteria bacterium]|nr:hypothetical protein [Deltaproteobacteria bacterium]
MIDDIAGLIAMYRRYEERVARAHQAPPKKDRPRCNARTRTGKACQAPVVWDRQRRELRPRCRMHGGKPLSEEARARIADARRRFAGDSANRERLRQWGRMGAAARQAGERPKPGGGAEPGRGRARSERWRRLLALDPEQVARALAADGDLALDTLRGLAAQREHSAVALAAALAVLASADAEEKIERMPAARQRGGGIPMIGSQT